MAKTKGITQPDDWWAAFEARAAEHQMSLSEWFGELGKTDLPKKIRDGLSERPPAHRPKKDR